MNKIDKQIKDVEEKLKLLKQKKVEEENNKDFIYIKELNIEVQKEIHHKGKSYDNLKEEFGEDFLEKNLPTYQELQYLRNLEFEKKYRLGLINTWEFVKQEDLISKKKGYVARFVAYSVSLGLVTYGYCDDANSSLGVRFVRRNIRRKK